MKNIQLYIFIKEDKFICVIQNIYVNYGGCSLSIITPLHKITSYIGIFICNVIIICL